MAGLDKSIIADLPIFTDVPADQLDGVLASARSGRYRRGSAFFHQEDEATAFFLLLEGHVRVVRSNVDGEQVIARFINAGELFGIAVAMARQTYPATAIAAVDCVALSWPNRCWPDLQASCPALGAAAYRTIGQRLEETQARVMEMSTEQAAQRVARAVLKLAQQSGRKTATGIEIDFPITRQELAEMSGTTLHTVSRLLSDWEGRGLVGGGRQKVSVLDAHELMLIAEGIAKD